MSKTALVLATNGTEDIELVVTIDVLRRANVNVTVAGLPDSDHLILARSVKLQPDTKLNDVLATTFDAVILPGGPGHKEYATDKRVGELLKKHESAGKILAAICAGPIAFKAHRIAQGTAVTSYPSVEEEMKSGGYKYSNDTVVVSTSVGTGGGDKPATIITSRGPGTTFEFALKIVELLAGNEVSTTVRKALLL